MFPKPAGPGRRAIRADPSNPTTTGQSEGWPRAPYVAFTDCKLKTPSGRMELYKEELVKPCVVIISEGSWVKDFPAGDPYSLTYELVSSTSENYAFFETLVEIEAVGGPAM